ncbi:MAG: putative zinc-binding metallopeptidase [Bacteroidota bacterium]
MNRPIYLKILVVVMMLFMLSCREEDDNLAEPILGLGGDTWTKGELDQWLFNNFTSPYNIEVKYRWDASESDITRNLVPPSLDKVIPIMEVVRKGWIEPYIAEAGAPFLKKFCPKQYVLVGSASFNPNGTIILGQAEGGRKVVLFRINDFSNTDTNQVKEILHTIHHEFAHILHQNVLYPEEYKHITPGGYTGTWYLFSTEEALSEGFITPYSKSGFDDDFVEMVATMLVEGKVGFNALINGIPQAAARSALRQKEQIVVNYFTQVYGIDIYHLQATTEAAIKEITK